MPHIWITKAGLSLVTDVAGAIDRFLDSLPGPPRAPATTTLGHLSPSPTDASTTGS